MAAATPRQRNDTPAFQPFTQPVPPVDLSGVSKLGPAIFHPSGAFQSLPQRKLSETPGMHQPNAQGQDPVVPTQQGYAPPPSLASLLSALKGGG